VTSDPVVSFLICVQVYTASTAQDIYSASEWKDREPKDSFGPGASNIFKLHDEQLSNVLPSLRKGDSMPNSAAIGAHSRVEAIADRIWPLVSFSGLLGILLTSFQICLINLSIL
jgi:hypothetical protein